MGEKSEQKRQLILDTARQIFAQKGFAKVTMKDIIDASQISRGGIYLYFDSTAAIFEEVLRQEDGKETAGAEELTEDATAVDVLLLFLKEEKKKLLKKKDNLAVASYEYHLAHGGAATDNLLRRRMKQQAQNLAELIEVGVANGEFYCESPEDTANQILYVLEGLRISVHTMGISSSAVDRALLHIVQSLVAEV